MALIVTGVLLGLASYSVVRTFYIGIGNNQPVERAQKPPRKEKDHKRSNSRSTPQGAQRSLNRSSGHSQMAPSKRSPNPSTPTKPRSPAPKPRNPRPSNPQSPAPSLPTPAPFPTLPDTPKSPKAPEVVPKNPTAPDIIPKVEPPSVSKVIPNTTDQANSIVDQTQGAVDHVTSSLPEVCAPPC